LEDREHSKASRPVIDCLKILEAHTFFRKEKLTHEVNLFKFQKISTMVSTASTIAILWVTSNGVISCYQLQHRDWCQGANVGISQAMSIPSSFQQDRITCSEQKKHASFLVASEYMAL
jgi:hypothetical protein